MKSIPFIHPQTLPNMYDLISPPTATKLSKLMSSIEHYGTDKFPLFNVSLYHRATNICGCAHNNFYAF